MEDAATSGEKTSSQKSDSGESSDGDLRDRLSGLGTGIGFDPDPNDHKLQCDLAEELVRKGELVTQRGRRWDAFGCRSLQENMSSWFLPPFTALFDKKTNIFHNSHSLIIAGGNQILLMHMFQTGSNGVWRGVSLSLAALAEAFGREVPIIAPGDSSPLAGLDFSEMNENGLVCKLAWLYISRVSGIVLRYIPESLAAYLDEVEGRFLRHSANELPKDPREEVRSLQKKVERLKSEKKRVEQKLETAKVKMKTLRKQLSKFSRSSTRARCNPSRLTTVFSPANSSSQEFPVMHSSQSTLSSLSDREATGRGVLVQHIRMVCASCRTLTNHPTACPNCGGLL